MKGARALASGMLVLAATCIAPAISAAQDAGTTTDATTTTTGTTPEPAPPPPVATPSKHPKPKPPEASPTGSSAGTSSEAAASTGETSTQLGRVSPAGGARKSASANVTIGDFFFSPSSVSIAVGDTVTWRNTGQAPHNATADDGSFKTPTLNNGQSASHTFNQAGTFSYICTIHPNMHGTVRVLSSSGGGNGGGGSSSSGSSASSSSEASAVASPSAAGDANTLPMTGMTVGGLMLVGFALLALGLVARQADRERSRRRWLSIF